RKEGEGDHRRQIRPTRLGIAGERRAAEEEGVPTRYLQVAQGLAEVRVPGQIERDDIDPGHPAVDPPDVVPGDERGQEEQHRDRGRAGAPSLRPPERGQTTRPRHPRRAPNVVEMSSNGRSPSLPSGAVM